MPDETKPDATRPAFRLRAALAVPAGWPPDVAPNQIITAAHINSIKASVYAWPGDVDGQNHTLSNVNLVNATGVLADPTTTAGDLIARGALTIGRFAVGAAGQVLTVDLTLPQKLKWATPAVAPVASVFGRVGAVVAQAGDYTAAQVTGALADLLTTKGDIFARGAVTGRMPVGLDGQVLRVDSAQAQGLRWGSESVPSVFGRSGAPVVAQAGDYTAAQITNAVSVLGSYPDPVWITSFSYGKLIGLPTSFTPAAHTHDAAAIVTGVLSTARLGTGVANNTVYLRGDGTWAAAGTGGGGGVISVFGRAGDVIAQSGDYTAAMVGAIPANLLTSTGDLLVRNNINQLTRLPIGANGQVLQTDLATSVGMKWTSISASVQTPWVTNIDGSNFDLVNVHRLGVALAVPNYAVDVVGDVNYTGVLRSNGVPVVFGGSQTPWTQNINASGFSLNNAGTIGVGVTAPQAAPIQVATHTPGIAGSLAVQDLDATTAGNPVLLVTGLGSEGTRSWAVGNRGGATFLKDLYVWNDRASALLFGTNSAERMRITAAGLVGIGRTPATYPLEVQGDVSVTGVYRINGVPIATSQTPWTQDIDGAGFRLINTGNVGIGTTSPISKLQVGVGSPLIAGVADFCGLNRMTAEATAHVNILSTDALALDKGGTLGLGGVGGGNPYAFAILAGRSEGNAYAGYFQISTTTAGASVVERMRITAAGNVGIGTTSPIGRLSVAPAGAWVPQSTVGMSGIGMVVSGSYAGGIGMIDGANMLGMWGQGGDFYFGNGPTSGGLTGRMIIAANGNVGIGPSPIPTTTLELAEGTQPKVGFYSTGGNANQQRGALVYDGGQNTPGGGWTFQRRTDAGGFSANLVSIIVSTGRVGILTTSPGFSLDVVGDVNCSSGLYRFNGAAIAAITTRTDVTASRALNSGVYQNTYGRPMFVNVTASVNASQYMQFLTDGGNPPVAINSVASNGAGVSATLTVSAWVMPGHYYKVFTAGASLVIWIEWT